VLAPTFHLISPDTSPCEEDGEDTDEDVSDEAVGERHNEVLNRMRERWALIAKLKQDQREAQTALLGTAVPGQNKGHSAPSSKKRIYGGAIKQSTNSRKRGRPPKPRAGE
jgi:hypothetical protein